jgi:hypothetical protein
VISYSNMILKSSRLVAMVGNYTKKLSSTTSQ